MTGSELLNKRGQRIAIDELAGSSADRFLIPALFSKVLQDDLMRRGFYKNPNEDFGKRTNSLRKGLASLYAAFCERFLDPLNQDSYQISHEKSFRVVLDDVLGDGFIDAVKSNKLEAQLGVVTFYLFGIHSFLREKPKDFDPVLISEILCRFNKELPDIPKESQYCFTIEYWHEVLNKTYACKAKLEMEHSLERKNGSTNRLKI